MEQELLMLISLLKEKKINRFVLPVNSPYEELIVKNDFCVDVIFDNRSLAYYAMGISQQSLEPVVILIDNDSSEEADLLPGLTEAYYQNVPILIVEYGIGKWMKSARTVLGDKCQSAISIEHNDDPQTVNYKMNQALIALSSHRGGTSYLALQDVSAPLEGYISNINYYDLSYIYHNKNYLHTYLKDKTIGIILDECEEYEEASISRIVSFIKQYNCHVLKGNVYIVERYCKTYGTFSGCDLILIFGKGNGNDCDVNNIINTDNNIETWHITESLNEYDNYKNIDSIFECSMKNWCDILSDKELLNSNIYINEINRPTLSDIEMIVKTIVDKIDSNTFITGKNVYGINLTEIYGRNKFVSSNCYCDLTGKDGTLSVFVGQSIATYPVLNILFVEYEKYIRDVNALQIKHIKENTRICIFLKNKHNIDKVKSWVESCGYDVIYVENNQDMVKKSEAFIELDAKRPKCMIALI